MNVTFITGKKSLKRNLQIMREPKRLQNGNLTQEGLGQSLLAYPLRKTCVVLRQEGKPINSLESFPQAL